MKLYLRIGFLLLASVGLSSCSHRNRESKAATQDRLIQSVADTNLYTFVLSNRSELYRFSPDLSEHTALALPEEARASLYPLTIDAVGSHLFLLSQYLHYSADYGQTWVKITLPTHGMNLKCFSVDTTGQVLIGYHDGLWYAEHPITALRQVDGSRVDDCLINGPLLMHAHHSLRELRSIPDNFQVLSSTTGYGITAKDEANHAFYLVSPVDQAIFFQSPASPIESHPIPLPQASFFDLAMNDDTMITLSSDAITWIDRKTLEKKSFVRRNEQSILLKGERVLLFAPDRISLMIGAKPMREITIKEEGFLLSEPSILSK